MGSSFLIALSAQVAFGWPVPITGQTFAVLMAAVFMGGRWGAVSTAIYAGLGFIGVPWFSGWAGGLSPTSGYIIGFILAAFFLGHFTDKYIRSRSFFVILALMLFADFILIWIPGLLWRTLWVNLVLERPVALTSSLIGSIPFVPGDIIKIVAAAMIARGITTRQAFNS